MRHCGRDNRENPKVCAGYREAACYVFGIEIRLGVQDLPGRSVLVFQRFTKRLRALGECDAAVAVLDEQLVSENGPQPAQ